MSNPYFHFKQFTVHQDRCAMKVSTDACIQGAWAPILPQVKNVLDIGTGTGLLSLMLAQRNDTIQIDAIELDEAAAQQATENVQASPWANRINIIHGDARTFNFQHQYDMVICNPPFFNNSLLGDDNKRNSVRHTLTLSYNDLFMITDALLIPGGYVAILLPVAEYAIWQQVLADKGWHTFHELMICPREGMEPNRVVSLSGNTPSSGSRKDMLVIKSIDNAYTPSFKSLMQDYYASL